MHPTSVGITTVTASPSPTLIISSPVQEKTTKSNTMLILIIATATSAALLTVVGIVVMTIVCASLVAKLKIKSFKLSSNTPAVVDKRSENDIKVSIHVQDVVEGTHHYIKGTRKKHLSPVMAGSRDTLQYDQPQVISKQASPDPDTTTEKSVSEDNEKSRLFTVTDDDKPTGESHGSWHRYNNVVTATSEQAHSAPTASKAWPIRGNQRVVQPYSSVTIAMNFGIPMKRNEAYGSMENLTTDDATTNNAEDDASDYDDIL